MRATASSREDDRRVVSGTKPPLGPADAAPAALGRSSGLGLTSSSSAQQHSSKTSPFLVASSLASASKSQNFTSDRIGSANNVRNASLSSPESPSMTRHDLSRSTLSRDDQEDGHLGTSVNTHVSKNPKLNSTSTEIDNCGDVYDDIVRPRSPSAGNEIWSQNSSLQDILASETEDVDDDFVEGEPASEIMELENRLALLPVLVKQNSDLRALWESERERAGTLQDSLEHLDNELHVVIAARDEARLWEGLYRFRLELHQQRAIEDVLSVVRTDLPGLLQVKSCELVLKDSKTSSLGEADEYAFVFEHQEPLETEGIKYLPIYGGTQGLCAVLRLDGNPLPSETVLQSACEEIGVVLSFCVVDSLKDQMLSTVNKALADSKQNLVGTEEAIKARSDALRAGQEVIAEAITNVSLHTSEMHFMELVERGIRLCIKADFCAIQYASSQIPIKPTGYPVHMKLDITLGDREAIIFLARRHQHNQQQHPQQGQRNVEHTQGEQQQELQQTLFEPWEQRLAIDLAKNVYQLYLLSKELAQSSLELDDGILKLQEELAHSKSQILDLQNQQDSVNRTQKLFTFVLQVAKMTSEAEVVEYAQKQLPSILSARAVQIYSYNSKPDHLTSSETLQVFSIDGETQLALTGAEGTDSDLLSSLSNLMASVFQRMREEQKKSDIVATLTAQSTEAGDTLIKERRTHQSSITEHNRFVKTARLILEKLSDPLPLSLRRICTSAQECINAVIGTDTFVPVTQQYVHILVLESHNTAPLQSSTSPTIRVVIPSPQETGGDIEIRLGQGLVGRAMSTGRTLALAGKDIARNEALIRGLNHPDTTTILCVPIITMEHGPAPSPSDADVADSHWASSSGLAPGVLGCIQVTRSAFETPFTESDGKLVRMIANHLAQQMKLLQVQTRSRELVSEHEQARKTLFHFGQKLCFLASENLPFQSLFERVAAMVQEFGCHLDLVSHAETPLTHSTMCKGSYCEAVLSSEHRSVLFEFLAGVLPIVLHFLEALDSSRQGSHTAQTLSSQLSHIQTEHEQLSLSFERFRKLTAIAASLGFVSDETKLDSDDSQVASVGNSATNRIDQPPKAAASLSSEDPVLRLTWFIEELYGPGLDATWYCIDDLPHLFEPAQKGPFNTTHWAGAPAGKDHVLILEEKHRKNERPYSPGRFMLDDDDFEVLAILAQWLGHAHDHWSRTQDLEASLKAQERELQIAQEHALQAETELQAAREGIQIVQGCLNADFLERFSTDLGALWTSLPSWILRGAPSGLRCKMLTQEELKKLETEKNLHPLEDGSSWNMFEPVTGIDKKDSPRLVVSSNDPHHLTAAKSIVELHTFVLRNAEKYHQLFAEREDAMAQLQDSRLHGRLRQLGLQLALSPINVDISSLLRGCCTNLCADLGAAFVHAFRLNDAGDQMICVSSPNKQLIDLPVLSDPCTFFLPPLAKDLQIFAHDSLTLPTSPKDRAEMKFSHENQCTLAIARDTFENGSLIFVAGFIDLKEFAFERIHEIMENAVCLVGEAYDSRLEMLKLANKSGTSQSLVEDLQTRLEDTEVDLLRVRAQNDATCKLYAALRNVSSATSIADIVQVLENSANLVRDASFKNVLFLREDLNTLISLPSDRPNEIIFVDESNPQRRAHASEGLVGTSASEQTVIFLPENVISDPRYIYRIDGAGLETHPTSLLCIPLVASVTGLKGATTLGVLCVANIAHEFREVLELLAASSACAIEKLLSSSSLRLSQAKVIEIEDKLKSLEDQIASADVHKLMLERCDTLETTIESSLAHITSASQEDSYRVVDLSFAKKVGSAMVELKDSLQTCSEATFVLIFQSEKDDLDEQNNNGIWCFAGDIHWSLSKDVLSNSSAKALGSSDDLVVLQGGDSLLRAFGKRLMSVSIEKGPAWVVSLRDARGHTIGLLCFIKPFPDATEKIAHTIRHAMVPFIEVTFAQQYSHRQTQVVRSYETTISELQGNIKTQAEAIKFQSGTKIRLESFAKSVNLAVSLGRRNLCKSVQQGAAKIVEDWTHSRAVFLYMVGLHDPDDSRTEDGFNPSGSLQHRQLFAIDENDGTRKGCNVIDYVASMGQPVKSRHRMTLPIIEDMSNTSSRVLGVLDLHADPKGEFEFDHPAEPFADILRAIVEWCAIALSNAASLDAHIAQFQQVEAMLSESKAQLNELHENMQKETTAEAEAQHLREERWKTSVSALCRLSAHGCTVNTPEDLRRLCSAMEHEVELLCEADRGSCCLVLKSQGNSVHGLLSGCVIPLVPMGEDASSATGYLSIPLDVADRLYVERFTPFLAAVLQSAERLVFSKQSLDEKKCKMQVIEESSRQFEARLVELEAVANLQQAKDALLLQLFSCTSFADLKQTITDHGASYLCPGRKNESFVELISTKKQEQLQQLVGLRGVAIKSGQTICTRDVLDDPRYHPDADHRVIFRSQARGIIVCPLQKSHSSSSTRSSSVPTVQGVLCIWLVPVLSPDEMDSLRERCESLVKYLQFGMDRFANEDVSTHQGGLENPWAALCRELCADMTRPGYLKKSLSQLCEQNAASSFEGISIISPDRPGAFMYLLEDRARSLKGDAELACKSKSSYSPSGTRRIAIPCMYRDTKGEIRPVGVLHVCRGARFDSNAHISFLQQLGQLLGAFMRRILRERTVIAKTIAYEKRVSELEKLAKSSSNNRKGHVGRSSSQRNKGNSEKPNSKVVTNQSTHDTSHPPSHQPPAFVQELLQRCNGLEDKVMEAESARERVERDRLTLRRLVKQSEDQIDNLRSQLKRAEARQGEIEQNATAILDSARDMKMKAEQKRREVERQQFELLEEKKQMKWQAHFDNQTQTSSATPLQKEFQLRTSDLDLNLNSEVHRLKEPVQSSRRRRGIESQKAAIQRNKAGLGRMFGGPQECDPGLSRESKVAAMPGGGSSSFVSTSEALLSVPSQPSNTLRELHRVCEQMRVSQTKRTDAIRELINLEQVQLEETKVTQTPIILKTVSTVPYSTIQRAPTSLKPKFVIEKNADSFQNR